VLGALSLLLKIGLHAGLLAAIGFAFQRVALGAEFRRLIIAGALLLAVCVAARLFLLNAELAGGLEHAFDFSMFGWVWSPNKAQTLGYLSGAGVILFGVLARLRVLVILGAFALLVGVALGGHTRGLETPGLNPWIASFHVGLAAFWVSAPAALWPSQDVDDDEILRRMERFSAIAVWSVPLIFAGGVWLGIQLTGSFSAFVTTGYGRLLVLKLVFACGALAIGGANKLWVTGKLRDNPAIGRKLLRRTLMVDSLLFAGIVIAIASATSLTGPGA
jgi:putative copper export protein